MTTNPTPTGTWDYKNCRIDLQLDGTFGTRVAGRYLRGPSLEAVQRKIDKAYQFQPFTALVWSRYEDNLLARVTITGIVGTRGDKEFAVTKDDQRHRSSYSKFYPDNPETEAALKLEHKLIAEKQEVIRKLTDEYNLKIEAVRETLKAYDPDTYVPEAP